MNRLLRNRFYIFITFIISSTPACGPADSTRLSSDAKQAGKTPTTPSPDMQFPDMKSKDTQFRPATIPISQPCHSDTSEYSIYNKSSSTSNTICLAIKYVAYANPVDKPVVSVDDAISNINSINKVWSQCHIQFQIDSYQPVDPSANGLTYNTADSSELNSIRTDFESSNQLLIVTTGAWDRTGTLGDTAANAWTNMPGEGTYGVILEAPVGTYQNIVAHEIGHYLDLDHVGDSSNLMNPIIYTDSTELTQDQCDTSRSTAKSYWSQMYR